MSRRLVSKRLPSSLRWDPDIGLEPGREGEVVAEELERQRKRQRRKRFFDARQGHAVSCRRQLASLDLDAEGREAHSPECPRALVGVRRDPGVRREVHHELARVGAPELPVGELLDVVAPGGNSGQLDELGRPVVGGREVDPAREEANPGIRPGERPHGRLRGVEECSDSLHEPLHGLDGSGRAEGEGEGEHGRGVARRSAEEGRNRLDLKRSSGDAERTGPAAVPVGEEGDSGTPFAGRLRGLDGAVDVAGHRDDEHPVRRPHRGGVVDEEGKGGPRPVGVRAAPDERLGRAGREPAVPAARREERPARIRDEVLARERPELERAREQPRERRRLAAHVSEHGPFPAGGHGRTSGGPSPGVLRRG